MTSSAPFDTQNRFHRYVAILFSVAVPAMAVVQLVRAVPAAASPLRLAGYLTLTAWAVHVARRSRPNALPLVLATMGYLGSLSLVGAHFAVEMAGFDSTSSYGMMLLLSVLAGTLVAGRRLVWAAGLATAVAGWVIAIGLMERDDPGLVGVRSIVAVSGVLFTAALISLLVDRLSEAIAEQRRLSRFQDAIARCSEALLVHSDSFAVYEAVKALLDASAADYVYVDKTVEIGGEPGWEIVADAGRGSRQLGGGWFTGRYADIPDAYELLSSGKALIVNTRDLEGGEWTLYSRDRIQSEAAVPIFLDGEFMGSVGFIQYTDERRWSDLEIQTLWRAAQMIAAYWDRVEVEEELRASNESKDRLLASVSHEIRTPLTAIVGLSEEIIANQESIEGEMLAELNGIIATQSRELAELVEDLLVASRADFGSLSIRPEDIDLRDHVERVLSGIREKAASSKVIAVHGDGVTAWADPLRVRQILRNLISNAVKYGGDHIAVIVREGSGQAQVVVADDGPGVSDRESDLIFERYYRSAQSPTQPGSVGIGLSVSRQLAEMMGGTLAYRSSGGQPRFELVLPLHRPTQGADRVPAVSHGAEGSADG